MLKKTITQQHSHILLFYILQLVISQTFKKTIHIISEAAYNCCNQNKNPHHYLQIFFSQLC